MALALKSIQHQTQVHRRQHGCGAYTFLDGEGLTALATEKGVTRALELGTALGYTACCIAAAVPSVKVDTIEGDPVHVKLARENISEAGFTDQITVHEGDFEAVMDGLPRGYDFAFFDGFEPTPNLIDRISGLLVRGGILVCANMQFAGLEVENELNDEQLWRLTGTIEGGGTRAFVKL
jgi:predicted O-methyltransferase YrrM